MSVKEFLEVLDAVRYENEITNDSFQELKLMAYKYYGKIRNIVDLMEENGLIQL
jgi:hypothetical protein